MSMADLFDKEYRTTALDLIRRFNSDLTGKTALITGCTTGIGVDTARALAAAHCTVFIHGRNTTALHTVRDQLNAELKSAGQPPSVHAVVFDLADLPSIRAGAADFLRRSPHLHLLVLNAGVMGLPYSVSQAGVDMQFAVNHVGHFLLFQLLTPALLASTPARVVVLSSMAHTWGMKRIDYSRLPSVPAAQYSGLGAYQQSKLANIFFAQEVHRRYATQGLTAYSVMPGGIKTGLQDDATAMWMHVLMWVFARGMKTVPQGAATSVYCAVAPGLETASGEYFNNSHVTDAVARLKLPEEETRKLWEWTEKFVADHA